VEKRSLSVYEALSGGVNLAYERLHVNLQLLKLNTIDTTIDNYLEIAAKEGKTTLDVLDYLVYQEKILFFWDLLVWVSLI
jgi:hypothetical protein